VLGHSRLLCVHDTERVFDVKQAGWSLGDLEVRGSALGLVDSAAPGCASARGAGPA
jgi:hypothetical protein